MSGAIEVCMKVSRSSLMLPDYSLIIAELEIGEHDLKNCLLMCDELGLYIVIHVSDMDQEEAVAQGFRL